MMNYNTSYNLGIDKKALSQGFVLPLKVNCKNTPHILLCGSTGSGKTYALKYILKQLSISDSLIYLCDYKGIDFVAMQECDRYYKHQDVSEGLKTVFNLLQERMENPTLDNQPCFLVFDEWSGFLASTPKKQQEEFKQQLASILMLGRGASIFLLLAMQRCDTTNFLSGARDNFGVVIGLGRLSKESARMMFPDEADLIEAKPRGQGYLRVDGQPMIEIIIPKIRDMSITDKIIKNALNESKIKNIKEF